MRQEQETQRPPVDWVARAQALAPQVEAAAARIEAERRIVGDVVTALQGAGLFHMLLPASLGGGGADLVAFNHVVETIAAADGSTAWCLSQQAASTQAAGYLAPEIAREVFAPPAGAVAWGPPSGARAVVTDGGYVVDGRWRFASGSGHCTWLGGHASVIERDGTARVDENGRPVLRTMLFRKEKATIEDIWHVVGLRGTGSNAYAVRSLFVPEPFTTWRDAVADRRDDSPIFNIPLLTLYGIGFSGVGLGLARGSLEAFMSLAARKPSRGPGSPLLCNRPTVQARTARAMMRLSAARAFLTEMLQEIWTAATTKGSFSLEQRARLRLAITGAFDSALRVVDFAYHAAGTDAIFAGSPFERRFRDIHTVSAQGQANLSNFESAGQALFGFEPNQRL